MSSKNKKTPDMENGFLWNTSTEYLNNELPNIRKKSINTVETYRRSLNAFIDYMEKEKGVSRLKICFFDFSKDNIKSFLIWMKDTLHLSEKTCNLRITAIKSLLSYASEESINITPIYVKAKEVRGVNVPSKKIEYFEDYQLGALFNGIGNETKTERRNGMMLILGYDAALRVSELIDLKITSLHIDAEVPYITVLGKGSKYRNVPLMNKTILHIKKYLEEFHPESDMQAPLFYAVTHGKQHQLSDDTVQNMLKKYADKSRAKVHMPEYIHFHMLRKTRAMDLYQEGCPLPYIQQLLGHKNISTTSGFYAFATLKTLADAIEKANPTKNDKKIWKNEEMIKKLYRL
jgi:site-specific recombinase XerD